MNWRVVGGALLAALAPVVGSSVVAPAPRAAAIIDGRKAAATDAPYMVAINAVDGAVSPDALDGRPDQWCGGVLLAPTKVLTAAHCVDGGRKSSLRLSVGSLNRLKGKPARAKSVWVHPAYNEYTYRNDIAIITLDRKIKGSVAKLATSSSSEKAGRKASVYGWGITSTSEDPITLRRAVTPIAADATCKARYKSDFIAATMLCTGRKSGGPSPCFGDSGGPLVVGGRVVGVVSWGSACGEPGDYAVYTQVRAFSKAMAAQLKR